MLSQRLTKRFVVVSRDDPALLEIPDTKFKTYLQTRNIADIQDEIDKLEVPPTMFYALPLKSDKEYLVDGVMSSETEACWSIFRHHVLKADNFNKEDGTPILKMGDGDVVDQKCREDIPRDVVQELAIVIANKANESTKPFTLPDTWLRTRMQSRVLRVATASTKTAKEPSTK